MTMHVSLRQLRALTAIARTGSFTLAAQQLFITQSALSGLIKELEQTLGVRLVDRSTRRVHLTALGESLVPQVDGVLHELDGILRRVHDHQALRTGAVRLATTQLLASTLVPELIAAFQQAHPGIQVSLIDAPADAVMARVFAADADLGISPEREPNSDITSSPLFNGPFMAVCPMDHPLARRRRIGWIDLMRYPVIALKGPFTDRLIQDLHAASTGISFRPTHTVSSMGTALSMVKAGLGVGLCIPFAQSLVQGYGLMLRPLGHPEIRRSFEVLTRRGRSLSPAAEQFLAFIGPRIRALPHLR
jgi:DNA-binding transcriptional LysR family regulator